MIFIQVGGYGAAQVDFIDGMTAEDATLKLKEEARVHFEGSWQMQDTITGRVLDPAEALVDGRIYYLTAALERNLPSCDPSW